VTRGRFFVHFFWGRFQGKFRGKFSSKKCWGKLEISAEKVLKNRFPKKFLGKFHGKSLSAEKMDKKSAADEFVNKSPKMYPKSFIVIVIA
jgi:hypothetical protein